MRLWKIARRYENKRELGEWLLRATKIEFKKDIIMGADFNQASLQAKCRHELIKLIHVMATKIQSVFRMHRVQQRLGRPAKRAATAPKGHPKKNGRHRLPRARSPGREVRAGHYPRGPSHPMPSPPSLSHGSPLSDVNTFRTLHFADHSMEGGEGGHLMTRYSKSAGVHVYRPHRPHPPHTKPRKATTPRADRTVDRYDDRLEKLALMAATYLPTPAKTPPGKKSLVLSELRQLRNDMVDALSEFESELEMLKEDFGRSIVSEQFASSQSIDNVDSVITGDLEFSADEDREKLKDELLHMQEQMSRLQQDLIKQRELNLIARKFEVNAADPVQWSAWTCIQQTLLRYIRRRKFRQRVDFLVEKISLLCDEAQLREALWKSRQIGSIQLAARSLLRVHTIVMSHSQHDNVIVSNYVPTNLHDLRLIYGTVLDFLSVASVLRTGLDLTLLLLAISNVEGIEDMVGGAGACEMLVAAMRRYSRDEDMCVAIVKVCSRMCLSSPGNSERLLTKTFYQNLLTMFVRNSREPDVAEKIGKFICKLYSENEAVPEAYLEHRFYQAMVECIREYMSTDPDCLFIVCKTVINLCSHRHENCRAVFSLAEYFDVYVDCLEANRSRERIFKQVAVMMVCINGKQSYMMEHIPSSRFVSVLLSVLKVSQLPSEEIVKSTVTLVYNFAGHELARNTLLSEGMDGVLAELSEQPFSKGTITGIRQTRHRLANPSLDLAAYKSSGAANIEDRLRRSEMVSRIRRNVSQPSTASEDGNMGSGSNGVKSKVEAENNVLLALVDDSDDVEIVLHCLRQAVEHTCLALAQKAMHRLDILVAAAKRSQRETDVSMLAALLAEHSLLFDVMTTFLEYEDIQFAGLKVLLQLPYTRRDFKTLGSAGVCRLVAGILSQHFTVEAVAATCVAYANLITSAENGTEESRAKLSSRHVVESIAKAMTHYMDNVEVMTRIGQLLKNLSINSIVNQTSLGEGGVCELLLTFLGKHKHDEAVITMCTRTILSLCANQCDANRVRFGSATHFAAYVDIIATNLSRWKICKHMCMVIVDVLGKGDLGLGSELLQSGIGPRICRVLEGLVGAKSPDDDLIQALLMLVACFVYNVEEVRLVFIRCDLIVTMKAILDGHYGYNIVKLAKVITNYLRKAAGLAEQSSTEVEMMTQEALPSDRESSSDRQHRAALTLTRGLKTLMQNQALREAQERAEELIDIIGRSRDMDIIEEALQISVDAGSLVLASKTMRRLHALMLSNATASRADFVPIIPALVESPHLLIDLMTHFLSDTKIQSTGLAILQQLPCEGEITHRLGTLGMCDLFGSILSRHLNEDDVTSASLSYAHVLVSAETGTRENRERMATEHIAESIINALRIYIDDADIVSKCFQLLRDICTNSAANQENLGLSGVGDRIMNYMTKNHDDEHALSLCSHTILSLCAGGGSINRDRLASLQAISFYMGIIRSNAGSPRVCKVMCMLLVGLSEQCRDFVSDSFFQAKVVPTLRDMLAVPIPPATAQALIMLTVHIIISMPMHRMELLSVGMVDTLQKYTSGGYIEAIRKAASTGIRKLTGDSKSFSGSVKDLSSRSISASLEPSLSLHVVEERVSPAPKEEPSEYQILAAHTITRNMAARKEAIAQKQRLISFVQEIAFTQDIDYILECLRVCVEAGSLDLALKVMRRIDDITYVSETTSELRASLTQVLMLSPHLILDVMSSFISIADIQLAGLRTFDRLPLSQEDLNRFGIAGCCSTIVDVLDRHVSDAKICSSCVLFAVRLTTDCDPNRLRVPLRRCCTALCCCIAAHPNNNSLVNEVLHFSRILCRGSSDIADTLGKCGLCEKIVSHIGANPTDESVIEGCIKTLVALSADKSSSNYYLIATREFFRQCMAVVLANPSVSKLCKYMCKLLLEFSSTDSTRVADELVYSGVAGDLALALDPANSKGCIPDVVEALLMLTAHFIFRVPAMASELVTVGMIAILRWHRQNTHEDRLQRVIYAGIQKLSLVSPSVKNEAARVITRQLSAAGAKNASRLKLQQCMSVIDDCSDGDTIVRCLRVCAEMGSVPLALKTLTRIKGVVSTHEASKEELRGSLVGEICSSPLLLLEVMSSFVSVRDIPLMGLHICDHLAMNSQDIDQFGACGGCHVMTDILDRHDNDAEMCLANLSFGALLIKGHSENLQRLPSRRCCMALSSVVATLSRHTALVEECFGFMRLLCAGCREIVDMMGKCGLCEKVLSHLMAHKTDETVVDSAVKSAFALCADKNSANYMQMASRDALLQYMVVIRANPENLKICKLMCKLLVDFSGDGEGPVGDELVFSGLAADLVLALNEEKTKTFSPEVTQALLMLAVHFAVNVPIMRPELTSVGMMATFRRFQESGISEAVSKVCALGVRKLNPRVLYQSLSMPIYDIFGIDAKDGSRFENTEANSDEDLFADRQAASDLPRPKSRISEDNAINEKFENLDASSDEDFVLDCLKTATDNGIVELAIRAMWRVHFLVDSEIDRKVILKPTIILDVLSRFPKNAEIQTLGIGVLLRLPKHPGNAERFGSAGALNIIAENLLLHSEDVDICETSLNLAIQLASLSVYNRRIFPRSAVANYLPDLIHKHYNHKRLMRLICNLITSVCKDSPDCQTCFGDVGVTEILLQHMASDPSNEEVIIMRVEALIALCTDNMPNRRIAVADRTIDMLVSTMTLNSTNTKVCKELCKLFVEICGKGEPPIGDALIEVGLVALLLDLLKVDFVKTTKIQTVQAIVMLVVYLIVQVPCLRPSFIENDTTSILRRYKLVFDDELKKAIQLGIQKLEPKVLERASSFHTKWKPQFSNLGSLLNGSSSNSLFKSASSEAAATSIQRCVKRFHSRKMLREKVKAMISNVDQVSTTKEVLHYLETALDTGSRDLAVVTVRRVQRIIADTPASPSANYDSLESVSKALRSRPKPLVDLMTAFLSIAEIQTISTVLLRDFTVSEVDADRMGNVGVCGLLYQILRRHLADISLSSLLVQYGSKLAVTCAANRLKLCRAKCCDVLHSSMSIHVENAGYMEQCFKFICCLCSGMPQNRGNIGNAAIGSILLKHLALATAAEASVSACLAAISAMCADEDPSNRIIFANRSALRQLLAVALARPQSVALCSQASKLLTELVGKDDRALDDEVLHSGIGHDLVSALSAENEPSMHPEVTGTLIMLVVQFIVYIPVLRIEFASAGMIEILQRHVNKSASDVVNKLCALGIRKLLSESAAHKDDAARKITKQLSDLGSKNAAKAKLQSHLSAIENTRDSDEIIQSVRVSVLLGSVELASKALSRIRDLLTDTAVESGEVQTALMTSLCSEPELLIEVMSSFISISDIQSCGISILRQTPRTIADKEKFGAAGACAQLTLIMHRHRQDPAMCASAVQAVLDLVSESARNTALLTTERDVSVLLEMMKAHSNQEELMLNLLELILVISNSGMEGQNTLGKAGMCSAVVKYLVPNITNEPVVSITFAIITCLCARNNQMNLGILASPKLLRMYLRIVGANPHNKAICKQGCKLLTDLIGNGDGAIADVLLESEIASDLVTALSEEREKTYDSDVLQTIVMTVTHFAVNVPVLCNDMAAKGMVDTLRIFLDGPYSNLIKKSAEIGIEKLRIATPAARDDAARMITRQLSAVGPKRAAKSKLQRCLDIIVDCADCDEIVTCLSVAVEMGNVELATKSVRRIREIMTSDQSSLCEAMRKVLCDNPDTIIRAMSAFMSIQDVQVDGLAVLGEIRLTVSDKEQFGSAGIHMLLSLIMHRHMTNESVCALALSTALEFVYECPVNADLFTYKKCCAVLQNVLLKFTGIEELMLDALQLVRYISDSGIDGQDHLGQAGVCMSVVNYLIPNITREGVVLSSVATIGSLCAQGHEYNCNILASAESLQLYLRVICSNPSNIKICNRVCKLMVTLCGTVDSPAAMKLDKSDISSDFVRALSEESEQLMSPDVIRGLVMLVVHIIVNVSSMRVPFGRDGMHRTLQRFIGDAYNPDIEKAAQLGVRKLTESLIVRDDAARMITRQLSAVGPKRAAKSKLQHCLDIIVDCAKCDEIVTCLSVAVEMGNVELATKTAKRTDEIIQDMEPSSRDLREDTRRRICEEPSLLLEFMSAFISIDDVQMHGLCILKHAPHTATEKEKFGVADVHKLITLVLHRHLSNPSLCAAALSAAIELVSGCVSNGAFFAHAKCCIVLQRVMAKYLDSDHLMLRALQLTTLVSKSGVDGKNGMVNTGLVESLSLVLSKQPREDVEDAAQDLLTFLDPSHPSAHFTVAISTDELSQALVRSSKEADPAFISETLHRIAAILDGAPEEIVALKPLASSPAPLLDCLSAFEADVKVVGKIMNIVPKILKVEGGAPRALANRKYFSSLMRVFVAHPTAIKVCKRLCMLLVDLAGTGEGQVGRELIRSGIAKVLVSLLGEEHEKKMAPDIMQAVIMLVVHFTVNVPVLRSPLVAAGMLTTLTRYSEGNYGDRVSQAVAVGIRKLTE